MKKTNTLDEAIENAVKNVNSDRAAVNSVLIDAMVYLKKNEENHRSTGMVVAKYFEALQRSNDQLIKILAIREKREKQDVEEFTAEDMYDMIGQESIEG